MSKIAESLGTVHTHTHTQAFLKNNKKKRGVIKYDTSK